MKLFKTVARFIVALPVAAPLLLLGWLLSFVWRPLGMIGWAGMWLLGLEVNVQ